MTTLAKSWNLLGAEGREDGFPIENVGKDAEV
jgi:hypothetical protein